MLNFKSKSLPLNEGLVVTLILVGFILVSILISLTVQPVWIDEVLIADPAVNLYLGNGFTSSAWYYQPKEEFWASNAPLHQILLYHWLFIFGLNPASVRSISIVLMAIAIFLIWLAVYRLNLVTSVGSRLTLIGLLICGAGTMESYLRGRYDCIGISLFAAIFLTYSIKSIWLRCILISAISIFIPIAGINLLPYGLILAIVLLIYLKRDFWRELLSLVLGTSIGMVFLYILYITNGVAKVILTSAGGHGLADSLDPDVVGQFGDTDLATKINYVLVHFPQILLTRMASLPRWFFQDVSFVALLVLLLGLAIYRYRSGTLKRNSVLSFGIAIAVIVPVFLGILRDYPFYYSWMAYIPVAICISSLMPEVLRLNKLWRFFAIVLIVAACLSGYSAKLITTRGKPSLSEAYIKVEQFVNKNINQNDRVYSDYEAYYPLKVKQVDYVLFPDYQDMMSDQEKQELSALIIKSEDYSQVVDLIGGNWVKQDELLETDPYNLILYRRK